MSSITTKNQTKKHSCYKLKTEQKKTCTLKSDVSPKHSSKLSLTVWGSTCISSSWDLKQDRENCLIQLSYLSDFFSPKLMQADAYDELKNG